MIPKSYQKSYQNFHDSLTNLGDQVTVRNIDIGKISQNFQAVQGIFQEQILTLTTDELAPSIASRYQSIQTEIYRTLRLLGTDLLFLRSSRKQGTTEQRLQIVRDHLEQLMGYCQVIITEEIFEKK